MISLFLAGVLVSGAVSQTVSSSHGHIGPNGGGTIIGTSVRVTKSFPSPVARDTTLNGTQTLHYCRARVTGRDVIAATTDPRGCAYAFPLWPAWWI